MEINSSKRCMPLSQAFEQALFAVDNVATKKIRTDYTQEEVSFSSPSKWVIMIIGSQEGVNLLKTLNKIWDQPKGPLDRINIIIVCLFSGNEELSAENANTLRQLVEQTREGAFLLLRCTKYDTKAKKQDVEEVILKVINSMQLYRSQNIPVIHEELNF